MVVIAHRRGLTSCTFDPSFQRGGLGSSGPTGAGRGARRRRRGATPTRRPAGGVASRGPRSPTRRRRPAPRRSRRPARRRRGRTAGCGRACRSAVRIGSRSWLTTSSVPPGATASSRLRTPRRSGVRGIDAYCADTRSNAAGLERRRARWRRRGGSRRAGRAAAASAATRSSARCEMSFAVTCQPCSASQIASPPSPAPTSSARPGARPLISLTSVPFGLPLHMLVAAVAVVPVGLVGRRSGRGVGCRRGRG